MKPRLSLLAAVAIISASALAYEVLLMRLFSIIQWHHFAYMIISLALLGYGISGVILALNRERLVQLFPPLIITNMLLFSCSAPMCFLLAQHIPFNPAEMLWTPVQLLNLCGIYLILALPFFFAANVVGLSLYHYKNQVSSIYAADLSGAGIGSVGIILLLSMLFPEKILTALMLSGVIAALLVSIYAFHDSKRWAVLCVIIGLAAILVPSGSIALKISPYKSLNQLLQVPGTKIIDRYSSPLGLIDVVKSEITPLRHAPGLSLNAIAEPPEQLAVFTDADNMTAITRYNGKPETVGYLDQTTSALPFHLKQLSGILILGAGTGSDILQANYHAVNDIDAVELNPQIVDLVQRKYADFAGYLYSSAHVNIHIDEARGYLAATDKTYDLINIPLLDAFGSSAAGLYSMAENYLYTEQSIREYLRHVRPNGYLSITRWIKIPPRDEPKLLATVINALKDANVRQPGQRILMIRGWQTSTLIAKNGIISAEEISRLKQFCDERGFDPVYYPGISESEVNRFNVQQQPYLYQAAVALLSDRSQAFIDAYKFNIEAATDDKPYLFHFFKWRTLPEILSLLGTGGSFLLESGYLLLIAALIQAILASLLLIALPLWLWKSKLGIEPGSGNHLPMLVYFFCLGLGFLFIEIAFIQKFILILHHPLYAITVVLSTFLLTAGAGSYFSTRLSQSAEKSAFMLPMATIALLSIVYSLGFEYIAGFLLKTGSLSHYLFSIVLIAPLGFCMGMPFPMALAKISQTNPALIPWAWGINGCASVISAILATLIAMQFGFTVLIFLAVVLYGIAAWCFPKLTQA
ncbi:SAM-dependent methyltransferase [Methylobacter sp.]|uniref:spermine/spermidine synthase domain-containing protein n=1 Tax=Methylobacter sp. TaxID=2051955 RepID=UPI0011F4640E|nr:SAM-dependent methyltransferase [Methylobacter sp.]TAK61823.1 MAG: SAM-dependent methyltransferase [Methylobacter sp.]